MLLLKLQDISKYFGDNLLFSFKELSICENDRIGLVGLNGSGKTTLLKIINNEIEADSGTIHHHGEISYFRQFDDFNGLANDKILKELNVIEKTTQKSASGGEKTRLRLAEAFSKDNHLLLLDEPTSNLDLDGINLLKKKLKKYKTFILISHDTDFLNTLCNKIIEIRDKKLYFYEGNYDAYKTQKEMAHLREIREFENYQAEKARLQDAYLQKMDKAQSLTKKPKNVSFSEYKVRNYVATSRSNGGSQKSMMQQAKSIMSRIDHLEVKEKPKETIPIKINFTLTDPPGNRIIAKGEDISFSYDKNVIFKKANFFISNKKKVAIVGGNGSGKTTLLNLIEKQYNGISIVPKAKLGILYQEFNNLKDNLTVIDNVLADSIQNQTVVRSVLANLLFTSEDIVKPVNVLSGGEKIKLSLAKLLVSDANVLVLDEPTNYLDIFSIEALKDLLKHYEGTVIFVSHDKNFIDEIATNIFILNNKQITMFEGNLSQYTNSINSSPKKDTAKKMLLEMRLTELNYRLYSAGDKKDELIEEEYKNILQELSQY